MSLGRWISTPAAVLVLVCFFLPWFSVSCGGQEIGRPTGYELAISGVDIPLSEFDDSAVDPALLEPDTVLLVVPLAAVLALGLIFVGVRHLVNEPVVSGGQIVLSLVALAYLALKWSQSNADLTAAGGGLLQESVKVGLIGSIGGLLLILIGAVVTLLQSQRMSLGNEFSMSYQSRVDTVNTISPPQSASVSNAGNVPNAPSPATIPAPQMPASGYESYSPSSPKTEVLRSEPQVLAWLVVAEGPRTGHQFRLYDVTSIGRDAANEIILDDTSLSNQHARIKLEDGVFFLYDLASTNGTFLYNGQTSEWQQIYREPIHDGQKIKLGQTVLHFMHVAPTIEQS